MATYAKIDKRIRAALIKKSLKQIKFDFAYKEKRVKQWQANEALYWLLKDEDRVRELDSSNVMLPKMSGFVKTWLSKIDTPPNIKYGPGAGGDEKRADYLTAAFKQDARPANMNFAMKDLVGKKQAGMYGRMVGEYHASSKGGYRPNLDIVDVYEFGIDPSAGGLDVEAADNCGRRGIIKRSWQLQAGAKEGRYIKEEVNALLKHLGLLGADVSDKEGEEVETATDEQDKEKKNRYYALAKNTKILRDSDATRLTEWYMTYKGTRYYLLLHEESGIAVRVCPLKEINKRELWPFWTWATDPELTEFWSMAPADEVREIFMAQIIVINQMLDNNERINKPMRYFDIDAVEDPTLLHWRRDGLVPFKRGTNMERAIKVEDPKPITNGITIYDALDVIQQGETGITGATKGLAEEEKVGIYEGNLQSVSDRFGLLNKSYSNAYDRFGRLYYYGLEEHLNTKMSVRILGPQGVEWRSINKTDIKYNGKIGEYDIFISASDAERNEDLVDKRNKLNFLDKNKDNQLISQKWRTAMEAEIVGFSADQIEEMFDLEAWGNKEILDEAQRDLEKILDGEKIRPNKAANLAYAKKFTRYLKDQGENLDEVIQLRIMDYISSIMPIVAANTATAAVAKMAKSGLVNPDGSFATTTPDGNLPEVPPGTPAGEAPPITPETTPPVA